MQAGPDPFRSHPGICLTAEERDGTRQPGPDEKLNTAMQEAAAACATKRRPCADPRLSEFTVGVGVGPSQGEITTQPTQA